MRKVDSLKEIVLEVLLFNITVALNCSMQDKCVPFSYSYSHWQLGSSSILVRHVDRIKSRSDLSKHMCFHAKPEYLGDRSEITTRRELCEQWAEKYLRLTPAILVRMRFVVYFEIAPGKLT